MVIFQWGKTDGFPVLVSPYFRKFSTDFQRIWMLGCGITFSIIKPLDSALFSE
jgi:hypothetical protein